MCGFAGFSVQAGLDPRQTLHPMADAIAHRGPDDFGYFGWAAGAARRWRQSEAPNSVQVGLGFRRLSILDLSEAAAQPMGTPEQRYWIVFNGQIYNFPDLKASLPGVSWRSTGDTEVLLHHLARHGIAGLAQLNGMYAFAFFDTQTGEMILARDPLGIKPLYYFIDARGIFFGSEIRSLLKVLPGKPELNRRLVSRYLMNGWVPDPDTLFKSICRVPPGHYLHVRRNGQVSEHRFWDLELQAEQGLSLAQWKERLASELDAALDRQMRSDVPLGFFLSGGVDSSLLAARAARTHTHRPRAFSIGFQWGRAADGGGDLRASRLVAGRFPIDREEIIVAPNVVDLLPKVIDTLEEPIADAAALCSYLLCQAARSKVSVLISGQGADEIFGGYPVYQAGRIAGSMRALPESLNRLMHHTAQKIPYSVGGRQVQSVHRLRKLFTSVQNPWPDPFLLMRSPFRLGDMDALLSLDLRQEQEPPYGQHHALFENAREWDRYSQMLYLDTKTYLPALNLAYSDKTAMAHSVELRVPFLDQRIIDLAEKIPARYKASLKGSKILLKAVAEQTLPTAITRRRKAGFGLPLRDWFVRDLQPMAADLLAPGRLQRQGLLNPELPMQWLKEHREMRADHCTKLYTLMTLQLWLEHHGLEG
ncbi:asparagine synthase (glutamine-hydrolyzing) [bacterium]|nr:asparagine synthase (glutamine-hydrolyzing) [bacterium]